MILWGLIKYFQCYLSLVHPSSSVWTSSPIRVPLPIMSCFPPLSTPFFHHSPLFASLVYTITKGYIGTSKDLRLGSVDERENVVFFLWAWVTSLNIILSISIHLPASFLILFILITKYYTKKYMCYIFIIHLSLEGYWDCFHLLAIVNRMTMEMMSECLCRRILSPFGL